MISSTMFTIGLRTKKIYHFESNPFLNLCRCGAVVPERRQKESMIQQSGKIIFSNQEHAAQVQEKLLSMGFRFFVGIQSPRPTAYGVMWRNKEIRTAANRHAFKAYGVPLVQGIGESPQREPKPEKQDNPLMTREARVERARIAGKAHKEQMEERVLALMAVVLKALKNIGSYHEHLYGTNSRCQLRKLAWEKFMAECVAVNGSVPKEGSLRTAIHRVLEGKGKRYMIPDSRRTTKAMKASQK